MGITKLKDFYKNKKVYITGITGFQGTWLALFLDGLGADVFGIGLLPTKNSLAHQIQLDKRVNVVYSDINAEADNSNYLYSMAQFRPDVVFHFASDSDPDNGVKDPYSTFNTNVMGLIITQEILRGLEKKVSFLTAIGSETKDTSPLSASRQCSEAVFNCYNDSYSNEITSTLIKNVNVYDDEENLYSSLNNLNELIAFDHLLPYTYRRDCVNKKQHILNMIYFYSKIAMNQYVDPTEDLKIDLNKEDFVCVKERSMYEGDYFV